MLQCQWKHTHRTDVSTMKTLRCQLEHNHRHPCTYGFLENSLVLFWLPQDVTVKSNFAQEWNERQTTLLALQLLHHKRCEIFVGQKAFSTPEGSSRQAILLHLLSLVQWLQQKCTEQQHDRNHREVMAEVTAERGRMGAVFLTLPLAWRFIRFGPHSRPPFDEIQYLDVWLSILEC